MKIPKKSLVLGPLPYEYDALEPILSARAMKIHYEGHHASYVKKFNSLLKERGSREDLEFNYSAHILHTLYFNNLAPPGSTKPGPLFRSRISQNFKNGKHPTETCLLEMLEQGSKLKGSGWTLLLENRRSKLEIQNIPNHELGKIVDSYKPILVIDVWEHVWAYDYPANKKDFLKNILSCINWDVVENRLSQS